MYFLKDPRVGIERNPKTGRLVISLESDDLNERVKTSPKVDSSADQDLARALLMDQLADLSRKEIDTSNLFRMGSLTPGDYDEEWHICATAGLPHEAWERATLIIDAGNKLLRLSENKWSWQDIENFIAAVRREVPEVVSWPFYGADRHQLRSQLNALTDRRKNLKLSSYRLVQVAVLGDDATVGKVVLEVTEASKVDPTDRLEVQIDFADLVLTASQSSPIAQEIVVDLLHRVEALTEFSIAKASDTDLLLAELQSLGGKAFGAAPSHLYNVEHVAQRNIAQVDLRLKISNSNSMTRSAAEFVVDTLVRKVYIQNPGLHSDAKIRQVLEDLAQRVVQLQGYTTFQLAETIKEGSAGTRQVPARTLMPGQTLLLQESPTTITEVKVVTAITGEPAVEVTTGRNSFVIFLLETEVWIVAN